MNKKELKAYQQDMKVSQITFNPRDFGAVRIHLVPPKFDKANIPESLAIVNGNYILPVRKSHALLLFYFMEEMKQYDGIALTHEMLEEVIVNTVKKTHKIYWKTSKNLIAEDLQGLIHAFIAIARGEDVQVNSAGLTTIGEYAPYMKAPHRMDLMVSAMTDQNGKWHCNNKCIHCYAAGQTHSGDREMSTEEWYKAIDKCLDAGIVQLTFTGGEPTKRKDLIDLIKHARFPITRVNTNGILLSEEYCKELKDAELDSIQITFYSSKQNIHNKLVGANTFKQTVNGIKNAIKAGLSVSVNTPLCSLNKDYVETLEYLYSIGVRFVTCSSLITTGNATKEKSQSTQLSKKELTRILEDAVDYCQKSGMEMSFTSPGWLDETTLKLLHLKIPSCGACLSNMAITPSGEVVPCQSWLNGETYGNILTDDWTEIWDKCSEIRANSAKQDGTCPLRKG